MQFLLTWFLISVAGVSMAGEKLSISGDVFDLTGSKKLFTYAHYEDSSPQGLALRNVYKDLAGKIVVNEKAQLVNGQLKSFSVEQKQSGESGTIVVRGKKVLFSRTDNAGKTKSDVEGLEKEFVVPLTLIAHIEKKWLRLLAGKAEKFRFGVWQRLETVGFKIWKDKKLSTIKPSEVVFVMKPTSYFIRALVDPIYFTFELATKKLLIIKGRTAPKYKKDGQLKALDALIRYKTI